LSKARLTSSWDCSLAFISACRWSIITFFVYLNVPVSAASQKLVINKVIFAVRATVCIACVGNNLVISKCKLCFIWSEICVLVSSASNHKNIWKILFVISIYVCNININVDLLLMDSDGSRKLVTCSSWINNTCIFKIPKAIIFVWLFVNVIIHVFCFWVETGKCQVERSVIVCVWSESEVVDLSSVCRGVEPLSRS